MTVAEEKVRKVSGRHVIVQPTRKEINKMARFGREKKGGLGRFATELHWKVCSAGEPKMHCFACVIRRKNVAVVSDVALPVIEPNRILRFRKFLRSNTPAPYRHVT